MFCYCSDRSLSGQCCSALVPPPRRVLISRLHVHLYSPFLVSTLTTLTPSNQLDSFRSSLCFRSFASASALSLFHSIRRSTLPSPPPPFAFARTHRCLPTRSTIPTDPVSLCALHAPFIPLVSIRAALAQAHWKLLTEQKPSPVPPSAQLSCVALCQNRRGDVAPHCLPVHLLPRPPPPSSLLWPKPFRSHHTLPRYEHTSCQQEQTTTLDSAAVATFVLQLAFRPISSLACYHTQPRWDPPTVLRGLFHDPLTLPSPSPSPSSLDLQSLSNFDLLEHC